MIFEIEHFGGPLDGTIIKWGSNSWIMRYTGGITYASDEMGEDCEEWKEDGIRTIRVNYVGVIPEEKLEEFIKSKYAKQQP